MKKRSISAVCLLAFSSWSQATVIFSDNFNAATLGSNLAPPGWSVTNGTVDVVGATSGFDPLGGNGRYIDLDGSTSDAGVLSHTVNLLAGLTYTLTFDLAGSQRTTFQDIVDVAFGTTTASITVQSGDPFSLRTLAFTPTTSGVYTVSFADRGFDNVGALLDNVSISTPTVNGVPEPSVAWLFGTAVLGMAWRRRKAGTA